MIGKWARRWNRTWISRSVIVTSAGISMRSRKICPCLTLGVSAHALGEAAIQAAGDDEQRHVEVHLHGDRR